MPGPASSYKIAFHKKKLEAYLRNEQIAPATIELDITSQCNKRCPNCPSATSKYQHALKLEFIEQLFTRLEGETRGLLLSGGEPTMDPNFPEVLRMAREHGFVDIAVVTNGSLLDKEEVAAAVCAYASTARISIYDWTKESRVEFQATLNKIRRLKARVEREGSNLQVGVSALTNSENANLIPSVAQEVSLAAADWIYFHPLCVRWDVGTPDRVNQYKVLAKITESQKSYSNGFKIYTFPDRYVDEKISFSGYHAAHFLLVIGADGINYLGAEVKYHPQYAIADLSSKWRDDFLWQKERLNRIKTITAQTYPAVASRHRGVLYNHLIQGLINSGTKSVDPESASRGAACISPHIL